MSTSHTKDDLTSLRRLGRDWDELASADALWAVLSDPALKGGRWSSEEFFSSGEREIAEVLDQVETVHGRPERFGQALDFGCGAGRLTRALAGRFDCVVGVDVSAEMIRQAESLLADLSNVSLVLNPNPSLACFADGSMDFVYTNLVLQHLPTPELIATFFHELVRVTAPDGVAVMQAPCMIMPRHRIQARRHAYAGLRKLGIPSGTLIARTPLQPMRMTALARAAAETAIAGAGGTLLSVEPDGKTGFIYITTGPAN